MRIVSFVFVLAGALMVPHAVTGYTYGGGGMTSDMTPTGKLVAVVGPGFTITLRKGTTKVTSLKQGTYSIAVDDRSSVHNFHLTGQGVNLATKVSAVVKRTWTVTLKPGTYNYFCDPHKGAMKGTFKVIS